MKENRRRFIKDCLMVPVLPATGSTMSSGVDRRNETKKDVSWPLLEGPETPKLSMGCSINADERIMRRLKQIGVSYVSSVWGPGPWSSNEIDNYIKKFSKHGLTLINLMYIVGPDIVLGRERRDAEIELMQQSLKVAGEHGIPTVEYNFYVDRLTEGYFETEGRGGSRVIRFDYDQVKHLPAKPEIGIHKAEQIWSNLEYFLKAVVPVAERSGVRLALHPNDPVSQQSHGSDQIMASLENWKRLIAIIDSPSNGITYDSGVTQQIGEDPIKVCRYFLSRDRINHVHFRNVISEIRYEKYTEVFLDEGQVNMFAVIRELMKHGYNRALYPEHPHILDYDTEHPEGTNRNSSLPGGGGYAAECFNVGFARAMMLAVMSL